MKKTILSLFISVAIVNTVHGEEEAIDLTKVTVTANKTEKELAQVTSKTTVITDDEMEQYNHRNIKDLIRYEPGVMVPGSGRYGLSGFNIRGIGGDRILTMIDGIPIADEFSFGPNLSSRRNFVDIDSLKAVEIVRGPSSSLYGSNAIGGMVTFLSKDPADYLRGDHQYQSILKLGYDTVDQSFDGHFTYAAGNEKHQGMILATYRDGHETETYFGGEESGPDRKAANPMNQRDTNILAKWVMAPNDNNIIKLTLEKYQAHIDTNVLSQAGTVVFGTLKQAVTAEDEKKRDRFGFNYIYSGDLWLADELSLSIYGQDSESDQRTHESRLSPTQVAETRFRDSIYKQDNHGFKLNVVKDIGTKIPQQWVYGFDYDISDVKTLRTGQTFVIATAEQVPEASDFPTRDFPNSEYKSYGIYWQNEMAFFDQQLFITPGFRYDNFKLTPTADDVYLSGNTGSPIPEGYDESEVSAKLGLLWQINDHWSLFGQYAEGFKAPPIDAVNTGFTNFAGGYTTLPNPDLNPESSQSIELGFRYVGESHQFEVSYYDNNYDDFIESLAFKGFNPVTGLLEFQARNLAQAEISGFEFRGYWNMSGLLEGMYMQYAYANSEGQDKTTDLDINSVQPDSLSVGIGYASSSGRWSSELLATAHRRKTEIDASAIQPADPAEPAVSSFQTPGFTVLDWVGQYHLTKDMSVSWGVYNITDKKYWQWNDVLVQAADAPGLDRLTQPGRNASVTFKFVF